MSAPVAIPAVPTAGQTPAGSAWAQTAASGATGFEALLAALLPAAPQGLAGQGKGLGLIKDAAQTAAQPKTDEGDATAADSSALQAQLAALLAVQPVQVQPTQAQPTGETPNTAKAATAPMTLASVQTEPAVPTQVAQTPPILPQTPASPQSAGAPPTSAAPAPAPLQAAPTPAPVQTPGQPLIQPAVEPKAAPPPILAALVPPPVETPPEPAPETPAEAPPAVASAVAATVSADAKPTAKAEKPDASAPIRSTATAAAPAPAVQAETALAAQPAQAPADGRSDQPPPDQRETASSDKGAPDQVAAPTTGPASAAHMIQAEAAAVAARGAPETVAKLAAQIVKKLEGKSSRFDIALDPVGLGKVDVKVEINSQGQMTAALNFDSAAAAAELRGRAGELRAALEQAGFDMSGGNLSFSFAGQQGDSSQAFAQRDGQRGSGRLLQAFADDQPLAAPATSPSILGSRTSGVDVRI